MSNFLFYQLTTKEVFKKLKTSEKGLELKEAKKRLAANGLNKLPRNKAFGSLRLFLNQFKNPLVFILVAALAISYFAGHKSDSLIIFLVILMTNTVGFFQEWKANNALKKLNSTVVHEIRVRRGEELVIINREELVIGDVIELNPGDVVPADGRLFTVSNLKINEAPLTGESLPVIKEVAEIKKEVGLGDRKNMAYRETVVVEGRGEMVITAVGAKTEIGQVAKLIKETSDDLTPLQRQINKFGIKLGLFLIFANVLIFFIGVLSGRDVFEMFMVSVVIVVSAVPEGLIPAMAIILAIGMQRLAKKKGLVRRAVAAETLGSVSVICADKTGTLTQGEMMVDKLFTIKGEEKIEKHNLALKIGVLCNDGLLENPGEKEANLKVLGNPTDKAFMLKGASFGLYRREIELEEPRLSTLQFSSEIKLMATSHKVGKNGKQIIYVKGAPEKILKLSSQYESDRGVKKMTAKERDFYQTKIDKVTMLGARVIALAYVEREAGKKGELKYDELQNLTMVGIFSLRDQIRPNVKEAIASCQKAGIRVVIITGDHEKTAIAIAREIGFEINSKNVLDGDALDKMSDNELRKKVNSIRLYARVSPHHKLKIVSALQQNNRVVAMTGDGINDSPALKKADIGVAVGNGTDVAKEVADLVLLDNSFLTIIEAIKQGRITFNNIQKVILYLFTDCFQEMVIIGSAILLGWPLPILPVQVLWIKLIEDPLPAASLAFDKTEKNVMREKPRPKNQTFLPTSLQKVIVFYAIVMDGLALAIFYFYWKIIGDVDLARSVMFVTIGASTLVYIYAVRGLKQSIFKINPFSNQYLVYATLIGFALLVASVYLPFLNRLLSVKPLSLFDWIFPLGFGIASIVVFELGKKIVHLNEYKK
ncbi:MAG: cation-transporting P-type ATPase [Patescibacteria group bacterium]|nr:cation-transporting P-type ATPase [Patescibacteria group bacterium]MDD3939053.1 cation-transporting P-type ATPase [Patescibacteria group bacterium]